MEKALILTAVLACVAGAVRAGAEGSSSVPGGFAYQGVLSDPVTGPLTGEQAVAFRIFGKASGEDSLLWETNQMVLCSSEGLFHAWLEGDDRMVEAFLQQVEGPFERYLELEVEGHGEAISPRVEFTSVPQALLARSARQSAAGFAVAGDLTVAEKGALQVAATNHFDGGAAFTTLHVGGNAEWTGNALPLEVDGTVEAGALEVPGNAPEGSIAMWAGSTNSIPAGWVLCDGRYGTPNLQDRFLVGVGDDRQGNLYAYGDTGGENTVILTVSKLPEHSHNMPTLNLNTMEWGHGDLTGDADYYLRGGSGYTMSTGGNPNSEAHETQPHENRPLYCALYFIMKLK